MRLPNSVTVTADAGGKRQNRVHWNEVEHLHLFHTFPQARVSAIR